jgi:hypothetical protein
MPVTETVREKKNLLARVRRIRGQVEAIARAIESDGRLRARHAPARRRAWRARWITYAPTWSMPKHIRAR